MSETPSAADPSPSRMRQQLQNPVVLGLFSAAMLVWAFPPLLIDVMAGAAFIPIIWAARWLTPRKAGLAGLVASCGLLPSQGWMVAALGPVGIAVILVTNLSIGLAAYLLARCLRGPRDLHVLWLAPTIFVGIEALRALLIPPYSGFFALGAGAVATPSSIALTGIVPLVGVHGLSWALVFGSALSATLPERGRSRFERIGLLGLGLGLAAVLTAWFFKDESSGVEFSPETDVFFIGVQTDAPDLRQYERLTRYGAHSDLSRLYELAAWPAGVMQYDPETNPGALQVIDNTVREYNVPLLVGYEDVSGGARYNRAGLWAPGMGRVATFTQREPAIFSGFTGGDTVSVVDIGGKRVGVVIGTDINNSDVFRDLVANGAQAAIAIGNEGAEWGETGFTHQLVAMTLRAAEANLDLGRVTSHGISAVVRRDGQQGILQPSGERQGLASALYLRDSGTIYSKVGWLFPFLIMFETVGALIWGLFLRRREDEEVPAS